MADDLKQLIEEEGKKTRRHFDVVAEDLKSEIRQVAEGVTVNSERLERIEKQTEKIEPMQDDIEAIKVTLDTVKSELKRKADREELSALELKLRPS